MVYVLPFWQINDFSQKSSQKNHELVTRPGQVYVDEFLDLDVFGDDVFDDCGKEVAHVSTSGQHPDDPFHRFQFQRFWNNHSFLLNVMKVTSEWCDRHMDIGQSSKQIYCNPVA